MSFRFTRPRLACLTGSLTALALTCAVPAPASAAATFNCDASALRGTVLSAPAIEPATANRGQDACHTASGPIPDLSALPLPLGASVLAAGTTLDGPADRPDLQTASAVGGVADLTVRALPDLPIQLPTAQIPAQLLQPITVPLGLTTVTVDLKPAIAALLPNGKLPSVDLLRVQAATAYASAKCQGGTPQLSGNGQVTGISLLGVAQPIGQAIDQNLSLIDTQSISPSSISLANATITPSIVDPLLLQTVQDFIKPILDAAPNIEIPATLAHVKVTPGGQTNANGKLTQRALEVQVSIAGQSVADLVLGEASVSTAGVSCTPQTSVLSSSELMLQCTKRRLVLIDVLEQRGRVKLLGAADRALAGKTVDIVFSATGKVVAHAKVQSDGGFATTATLPARSIRFTNRARYQAVVGKERSLRLKLHRRMVVSGLTSKAGKVTIAGRVLLPLGKPARTIILKRRVSCSKTEVVKRFKPARDGSFRVTVAGPTGQAAAVYRMQTSVRKTTRNPKSYPTFTLPRAVELR
ncbi:MAG: hypothetical protein JWO74_3102 [Solirubrobacterales bacterium]|nr:hypothetical protein [Solirubrobacterales bacterium]